MGWSSAEWTAVSTGALSAATFAAVGVSLWPGLPWSRPKLRAKVQTSQKMPDVPYWHETRSMMGDKVLHARVWVHNAGRSNARGCRVKLSIMESDLAGQDDPWEFVLPVAVRQPSTALSPGDGEVSVDIPRGGREAFDLLYAAEELHGHFTVRPYGKGSSLERDVEYVLRLTLYADNADPRVESFSFAHWDGTEAGLATALGVLPTGGSARRRHPGR